MFQLNVIDNILALNQDLINKTYRHGGYKAFRIYDPKVRDIHKASVRDRLVHHAIYRILYPYFDRKFIFDSHSCRIDKGTHRAINRFREFGWKVSCNNTRTVWVLKCDIRKFFASIDHKILKNILEKYIEDEDTLWLLSQVIDSYHEIDKKDTGLPLGNLTSQLLVNIYLNGFDHFIKRKLKVKYYLRYADDFVIFSPYKKLLEEILPEIQNFLGQELKLTLHPDKIFVKTLASGVDFLGWIHFFNHRVLRNSTKWRMYRRMFDHPANETHQSYLGLLRHGNCWKIKQLLEVLYKKDRKG
ncbi:reverse transcriptase/maturase family protein [Patescibacteria group bacterium]|nr:reverse transcriptase/maturase family protein [Patescibacteria group bacterium]